MSAANSQQAFDAAGNCTSLPELLYVIWNNPGRPEIRRRARDADNKRDVLLPNGGAAHATET